MAVIPIAELDGGALERWRALAAAASEPNPFFEPDFVLAGAEHLDDAAQALVVVEAGGEWLAAMPVAEGRWRRAVAATRAWRGLYGFLATPLVAAGHEDALATLLRSAAEAAGGRALVIEGTTAITHGLPEAGDHPLADRSEYERALLRRRADGGYLDHVKPHHAREFKRQRRRLAEAGGGDVVAVDRTGDERAIEDFLALERSGWKGRADTALASAEGDARFFAEVCNAFRAAGRLQLLELRAGERRVAMKCNLLAAPGSFAFKIAFDEEFARFSPGIQLELENIEFFARGELEWMDSCADPDNAMINRLWPDRRALQTLVYRPPGARGATMMKALELALRAGGRTK